MTALVMCHSCLMRCLTLSMVSFGLSFKHRKFGGIDLPLGWIIFLLFVHLGHLHRQALVFQMLPTSEKL